MTGTILQMPGLSAPSALRHTLLPIVQSRDGFVCSVQRAVRRSWLPAELQKCSLENRALNVGAAHGHLKDLRVGAPKAAVNPCHVLGSPPLPSPCPNF